MKKGNRSAAICKKISVIHYLILGILVVMTTIPDAIAFQFRSCIYRRKKSFYYSCDLHSSGKGRNSNIEFTAPPGKIRLDTASSTSLSAHPMGITSAMQSISQKNIPSYWLVRVAMVHSLGFIYIVAFLVALHQNRALIGTPNGITPAKRILDEADERAIERQARRRAWDIERQNYKIPAGINPKNPIKRSKTFQDIVQSEWFKVRLRDPFHRYFWDRTDSFGRPMISLLWLVKDRKNNLDRSLDLVAYIGLVLACITFVYGSANLITLMGLWLCQRTLTSVGSPWYSFGWETMLAELTFHMFFMVPVWTLEPIPLDAPVPVVTIWALRWFIFRIMMGAGLIKLRAGDVKWKNLTVMNYFYETMPAPNMLTRYFHHLPSLWHKVEALINHFVELVLPWFLLLPGIPRTWRINCALVQIIFQATIIASGNFSFLNWLTMIPVLSCFDDQFLARFFFPFRTASASVASYIYLSAFGGRIPSTIRRIVNMMFGILIVKLSIPVVNNLLSSKQIMNGSFDRFRLINSYGAFGTVSEKRIELVVEASESYSGPWVEYPFKIKPGNIYKRPRWISPYHYRLDWQMWIASVAGGIDRSPWMYSFLLKLLQQDEEVLGLLEYDPWKVGENVGKVPKYIRVDKYLYKFSTSTNSTITEATSKQYWEREKVGRYFPRQGIASVDSLQELVQN